MLTLAASCGNFHFEGKGIFSVEKHALGEKEKHGSVSTGPTRKAADVPGADLSLRTRQDPGGFTDTWDPGSPEHLFHLTERSLQEVSQFQGMKWQFTWHQVVFISFTSLLLPSDFLTHKLDQKEKKKKEIPG